MLKRRSKSVILRHEINVTPFVDVMLVLLIIFMVATPMMHGTIPVDLPKGQGANTPHKESSVDISLNQEGSLFLRDKKVDPEQILGILEGLPLEAKRYIYIRAHRTLPYERITALMSLLKACPESKIMLVIETSP